MTAIQIGDKNETTWHASPGNYEVTARMMERRGFPELALEWWGKAANARRDRETRAVEKSRLAGCSSLPA
jgi:hypothetical protein